MEKPIFFGVDSKDQEIYIRCSKIDAVLITNRYVKLQVNGIEYTIAAVSCSERAKDYVKYLTSE